MEEFWKVLRAHRRLRHTFLFSLCVFSTKWLCYSFLTKSSLASYQELFCKITLLRVRDQNVEQGTCSARFGRFQVAFIVGLTSSNLKSECNAIVALSLRSLPFDQKRSLRLRFHHKYRRDSHIARLITYCLEFCQHRLRFISVYVNKKTSFQLLINKC